MREEGVEVLIGEFRRCQGSAAISGRADRATVEALPSAEPSATDLLSPLLRSTSLTRDDHAETVIRTGERIPNHIQNMIGRRYLDLQMVKQSRSHKQEQ